MESLFTTFVCWLCCCHLSKHGMDEGSRKQGTWQTGCLSAYCLRSAIRWQVVPCKHESCPPAGCVDTPVQGLKIPKINSSELSYFGLESNLKWWSSWFMMNWHYIGWKCLQTIFSFGGGELTAHRWCISLLIMMSVVGGGSTWLYCQISLVGYFLKHFGLVI